MENEHYEELPVAATADVTGNRREAVDKAKQFGREYYDTSIQPENIQVNWTNKRGKTVDLTKKAVSSYNKKFYFEKTPQNNSKFSDVVTMYPGLK